MNRSQYKIGLAFEIKILFYIIYNLNVIKYLCLSLKNNRIIWNISEKKVVKSEKYKKVGI